MGNERDDGLKFRFDNLYTLDEYIFRFQQFKELGKDKPEFVRQADEVIEEARKFPAGTRVGFILMPDGEIFPRFAVLSKPGPVL